MRLRRHGSAQVNEATHGIDLAPMLDFVLNLLIFFIITAVFVKEFGLVVNRPGGEVRAAAAGGGTASIPIQLLASGEVFVADRPVDLRAVRANIERLHAMSPGKGVLLIAEERVPTGQVIETIDQIHQGGVFDITFAAPGSYQIVCRVHPAMSSLTAPSTCT